MVEQGEDAILGGDQVGMSVSKADRKIAQRRAEERMNKIIDNGLNKQHKDVMAWVLHTKRQYGTKRAYELLLVYEELWACIGKKEITGLTLDDIEVGLLVEMDLYNHTDGNVYDLGKGKGKQFVKDGVIDHEALFEYLNIKG